MNIFKGKKIFAVLIALTLVLSSVPINSVNAKTNINNSEISVQLVNSTSIKVVAGKQTGYISVTKAKNGIKYVKGFESGKKPIVLKVDTKNETVTSKNRVSRRSRTGPAPPRPPRLPAALPAACGRWRAPLLPACPEYRGCSVPDYRQQART